MSKHIALEKNINKGYTLLVRLNDKGDKPIDCCPYVVAWCYDPDKKDWLAGHYFETLAAAVAFFYG